MEHNQFEIFLRNTVFGRLSYHISKGKIFKHDDEYDDYEIPTKFSNANEEIIVDWEDSNDLANPRNWSLLSKTNFVLLNAIVCLSVYIGAAIYTPGIEIVEKELNVSKTVATLPLTFLVIGYGIGPLVFGPLSEHPKIGRLPVYFITTFIFMILQIPTALVNNITGFIILRFIAGFFAAAPLGIGPAAICDALTIPYGPIGIGIWSISAVSGPSFGPLVGAILTVKNNWKWGFWFLCIFDGISLSLMFFLFPESYEKTILYKKALRLKSKTGNSNITSNGELELSKLKNTIAIIKDTLWRPIEMTITEPVVLLIHIYTSLMYALMYLWFEAFPIVFAEIKGFTLILMGLSFLSLFVGTIIGVLIYIPWTLKIFTRKVQKDETIEPEVFLPMTILGSILMPVGLFIFGWTSSPEIHWFIPMIGSGVFAIGAYIVFQCLFNYLGMSFWRYMASAFSGNACMRSILGGAFPLFGRALFKNLGPNKKFPVGWGSSILGFITVVMIAIPVVFYLNGPKLRARSKYAGVAEEETKDIETSDKELESV
ncbi:Cycloheximide resistance protein [Wickerhamomyces ciferrii]|uniref:Cycloheximide resistance protein n=1 Tax=Wickerhamomyces ciferrii (strain ATCC 14091 / BCRC 22168 / CBS 111 / JCM 3599 / NBRC 0793 / NRRL Y-1031 F-60-10) TaxID=1206466 RepID=K0KNB0_WICCF|nr:Cycloheximide resistance protein [Wickerhamomyces ciferrii]CCH46740.1 Cycloheximide resistance protein [Wickerhamomyces ciferrii]